MEKIYGINPVKVLLQKGKAGLEKVFIAAGRGGAALQEITSLARQKNVPVEIKKREDLDKLLGVVNHQGVVAICRPYVYADIDTVIGNRHKLLNYDLVVILDGIVDPQNLGSIIRSAFCFGANGIIIPADRAAGVTAAVIKASAGSALQIPVTKVTNLSRTIDFLKENGFWVFGTEAHTGKDLREVDFNCRVALLLGGEAKGIRPLLKKKCDTVIGIPMTEDFDSFNVAVAAGIIQYEIFCQRKRDI
ncbi:MAG TPA: 23S rRNA (guanosine(2251)-2'-O)-methyltransferase RlmB [Smithellaceae bacterium]|nr:23S rRNA (guanosine(2251)-2'-O)-methyltransferase RlmB [Smithellaceae bacterium]HRS89268.1 23S rRNA (guanosine(2251)-2'-O)-methyltransferase RlmB [Smithellaceae bacterium]HRV26274.1 23S rRNA (guanosine(2251)-2'-O)-methyltransferase RlmB [Smithellaceae bacterium]